MDKKSKYRISIGDSAPIITEELTPAEFFSRIIGLKHRYNPTFSVFDEETNNWTCFQSTAIEPVVPKSKLQRAHDGKGYSARRAAGEVR